MKDIKLNLLMIITVLTLFIVMMILVIGGFKILSMTTRIDNIEDNFSNIGIDITSTISNDSLTYEDEYVSFQYPKDWEFESGGEDFMMMTAFHDKNTDTDSSKSYAIIDMLEINASPLSGDVPAFFEDNLKQTLIDREHNVYFVEEKVHTALGDEYVERYVFKINNRLIHITAKVGLFSVEKNDLSWDGNDGWNLLKETIEFK